jgi:hypothetical protein
MLRRPTSGAVADNRSGGPDHRAASESPARSRYLRPFAFFALSLSCFAAARTAPHEKGLEWLRRPRLSDAQVVPLNWRLSGSGKVSRLWHQKRGDQMAAKRLTSSAPLLGQGGNPSRTPGNQRRLQAGTMQTDCVSRGGRIGGASLATGLDQDDAGVRILGKAGGQDQGGRAGAAGGLSVTGLVSLLPPSWPGPIPGTLARP